TAGILWLNINIASTKAVVAVVTDLAITELFNKAALTKANPTNKVASLALKQTPTFACHSNMASTNAGTNSSPKCPYSNKPPSHHQAAKLTPINPNKRPP